MIDRAFSRALSRRTITDWVSAGASFDSAMKKLIDHTNVEIQKGRSPTKVIKKALDQLTQLMRLSGIPGEVKASSGRRHKITVCMPQVVENFLRFVLVSGSASGRNGVIDLTRRCALTASKHVLERLHLRLGTKEPLAALSEVYSCIGAAFAMGDAAHAVGARHWPLITTNGLFVCAPCEGDETTLLITWMRFDQLGKKWGRIADDLRAAASNNIHTLEDKNFCMELLRLHSWLLRPHEPGPDVTSIWWASRTESVKNEAAINFGESQAEYEDQKTIDDDQAKSADLNDELVLQDAPQATDLEVRLHAVRAREKYQGIFVQRRRNGARIVALQNGFFGVLWLDNQVTNDFAEDPTIVQLGDRIMVEVFRVIGEAYTGPYSIILQLPDVADANWAAVQKRNPVGSIVSASIVWRGANRSVLELQDAGSGWLLDSELTWKNDRSDLREHLAAGQQMRVRIIGHAPEHRRFLLSLRQADPIVDWLLVSGKYPIGAIVDLIVLFRGSRGFVIDVPDTAMIGGVSGWLPDSELSWSEGGRAAQNSLVPGQQVRLQVTGYFQDERCILLSHRQVEGPPVEWSLIEARHPVGSLVDGVIVWHSSRRAVVEIADGISGWIFENEISWFYDNRPIHDSLVVGQSLRLKVIGYKPERRRLLLSLRQIEEDPFGKVDESTAIGLAQDGVVSNVVAFGAFVRLSIGAEGLIHKSDFPAGISLSKGDVVGVRILSIDKSRRRIGLAYTGGLRPNFVRPE